MTDDHSQLIRFLHQHRGVYGPAQAVAFRALIPEGTEQRPPAPRDAHDLYQCLNLTTRIPAATEALNDLADSDPHWAAIQRNWTTLHQNLAHETGGTLRYPWAERTTQQLTDIAHLIGAGTPADQIDVPLLSEEATDEGAPCSPAST